MMSRHALSAEVRGLIDEMLNGTISPDGVQRLEMALDENRAAQRFFREYCQLHINLDAETRAQRVIDCFHDRNHQAALLQLLDSASPENADELIRLAASHGDSSPRRKWLIAACSTAAAVCIAIGWFANSPQDVPRVEVAQLPQDPSAIQSSRSTPVRIQIATDETRYIPLADFGHLMLEGPADIEFVDPLRARLHKGRIKVRITSEKGHGFVVETPHGEVTDLGTEFGVDASSESDNGVVVFAGMVNLSIPQTSNPNGGMHTERLVQGEGLTFNRGGRLSRIMSIVTGDVATFEQGGDMRIQRRDPIIVNVTDNIQEDVRKFYEIVPGGLQEDALTYVDRPHHDWNGMDKNGMPKYLLGADYVKPFNNDKMRPDVELQVTLGRPARLFVFMDDRVKPVPDWLEADFLKTDDAIGLDNGPYTINGIHCNFLHGEGAGNSIDVRFSIWERVVKKPGVIKLGPNGGANWDCGMYCLAAIPLESNRPEPPAAATLPATAPPATALPPATPHPPVSAPISAEYAP